jgi:antitoxin component YwqK of YwqJK toxin-antitoxin module
MKPIKVCLVAFFLLLGLPLTGRAEDTTAAPDASKVDLLEPEGKQILAEFRKSLPQGYTAEVGVFQQWSDDEQRILTHLSSVSPIGPDGKIDGEVRYYAHTLVVRTVPYKKGVKDGVERKFQGVAVEGQRQHVLLAEIPWQNDKIQGVKKLYHANGKLRVEAPHDNGQPDGVSKEYDLNGRTVKVTEYKKGKRHGEMTEYWTLTGKPMRIVPYKNDKIEGLVRQFYDTGQLKKEVPARRDLFHGVEKQYDEEGALIKKRYWVDDQEIPEEEFLKKHNHLAE